MSQSNGSSSGGSHKSEIPALLRGLDRWIGWELRDDPRTGKSRKVPVHPDGRNYSTATDKPYPLAEILAAGLSPGFVLTDGVKIGGRTLLAFDLDACRDPETGGLEQWAEDFVGRFAKSYTEITPSECGLRLWALVKKLPDGELRKIRTVTKAPNTGEKKPEIETFGLGRACYVTVTGNRLPTSSPDIEGKASLEWLLDYYPDTEKDAASGEELPVGTGERLDLDTIDTRARATLVGELLADGKWHQVLKEDDDRDYSASAGFARLSRLALDAANGHGDRAVEWLLHRTAYGAGKVDSAEPDRYMRRGWVEKDLARTARGAKSDPDVFGASSWVSSEMPEEDVEEAPPRKVKLDDLILPVDQFLDAVEPREWLVDDLFPSDGLASIFGKPGQGKTPVALRLAVATAANLPTFFGRDMSHQGPAVYFVGEDESGVRDRVQGQLEAIDPLLIGSGLPLYFTREPGRISDPKNVELWVKAILGATGGVLPRLVVVDTLARNFGPGTETKVEDMQEFIDGCNALSRALGKCLVLAVHHPGHADPTRGRGGSNFLGALDTEIMVELVGKWKLVLTPTKTKGAELPDPFTGTLRKVIVGTKKNGDPRTAITLEDQAPDPAEAFGDETSDEATRQVLEVIAGLEDPKSSTEKIAELAGVSRKVARTRIETLETAGLVKVEKGKGKGRGACRYILTNEGSRYLRSLEKEEGQGPLAQGPGPSEGQEGQDQHNTSEDNE